VRKTIIAAVAASAITGAVAGSMVQLAAAQQTPPAGPPTEQPGMMEHQGMMGRPGMMEHPGWMRWMQWRHMHEGRAGGLRAFALFYRPADRQLTAGDVQKIAEALLLWHGNHSWKVADVAENPDNTVGFAYAAPDGTVIAKFTIDRKTGHIARVG